MEHFRFIFILCILLTFAASVATAEEAPKVTSDGLHRLPDTKLQFVYADPDANLAEYQKILLVDPQVAFKKDWQRDINQQKPYKVTAADMQRIRSELAAMFKEILVEALLASDFDLVTQQAEDVLIVRPAILDLNITSPDTARATTTRGLSRSAGDMFLYLELRDAITGDILVKALDYQIDISDISAYMRDKPRNVAAARKILDGWVAIMVNGLQETMRVTPEH
jgi:hypothetical protein